MTHKQFSKLGGQARTERKKTALIANLKKARAALAARRASMRSGVR